MSQSQFPRTRTVHQTRYGIWSGAPFGVPRCVGQCSAEVFDPKTGISRQCTRPAGPLAADVDFCKQHARQHAAGKRLHRGDHVQLVQQWSEQVGSWLNVSLTYVKE